MKKDRRDFLKIAGATAVGVTALSGSAFAIGEYFIPARETKPFANEKTAKRWGMVINAKKLNKELVHEIMEACHKNHNVPDYKLFKEPKEEKRKALHEIKWVWSEHYNNAFTPDVVEYLSKKLDNTPFLVMCNQCQNPPCVRACPTKATFKRPDGIVIMDFHRCIGCRFCMAACPYGSRSFNFQDPRNGLPNGMPTNPAFPTRMKGVVEKCNFCAERLAVGKKPYCEEVSKGAIVTGDLSDEKSEVRRLLEENNAITRKTSLGTGPSVFYIV